MLPNDKNHPMNQLRRRTSDINNDIAVANLRATAAYHEKKKNYDALVAKNATAAARSPVSKAADAAKGLLRKIF